MSTSSKTSSMSRSPSQANCLDPLDALIDFSEYDQMSYHSPSISPSGSSKPQFVRPVASTPTTNAALLPSSQPLSGPSHNYELYKQQTGIPTGAIQSTLNMNNSNMYNFNGYMSDIGAADEFIDFGTAPNIDMEFEAPATESTFFFPEQAATSSEYVDPSVIGNLSNRSISSHHGLPTPGSHVGRLWPGMHQQQAALAKAQQQQLIQQQRQQSATAQPKQQRSKSHQPTDPIVEEKISQLLNSMRQNSVATTDEDRSASQVLAHAHRMRKEEEDMDEDERLLASEEGKKLSSKERRQLRNKVSARAFRSRRKEYIGQLEGEIAAKVNENGDLRVQNRALMEENTRLSDLTRMLLSSPSFSGFLDTLTPNIVAAQQPVPAPVPVERPAETRQVPKDVNPYAAQQQMQNQQVNMTLIPDHTMDFSMLDLNGDGSYNYQPQVFSVLSMPEVSIDTSVLSGKSSNFVGRSFESDDEKAKMPVIEYMSAKTEEMPAPESAIVDEEFDSDPTFALFSQYPAPATRTSTDVGFTPLFGDVESEKVFARYELIPAVLDDAISARDMARVERLFSSLDPVATRLEAMTIGL